MDENNFWINTADIEKNGYDIGFDLYSAGHLIWLAAILAIGILIAFTYKGQGSRSREKARKIIAMILFFSEIFKDSVLIITERFNAGYLPFHLCGLAIFALLIDAFKDNKVTKQLIAYGFMPGAVSALLFCNWTEYPMFSFMCLHSFIFHAVILWYMMMRYARREIKPNYKGLWLTGLCIGVAGIPIYFFNKAFDTNYLFINEASEGSPLIFLWNTFGTRFGEPGYLVAYAALALAVFHVLYLIYNLLEKINNK